MGTALAMLFIGRHHQWSWQFIGLIFFTYLCGYTYTKYQNIKSKLTKIIVFNIIVFVFGLLFLWKFHNFNIIVKWLIIIVIGLLYDSRFLKYFVRQIPLFKIFYVGLTWALMSVWLPLESIHWGAFWVVLLYISALVLPFDIRDRHQDKIMTFPKLIGTSNTKLLAYTLLISSATMAYFTLEHRLFLAIACSGLISAGLVSASNDKRVDLYYSLGVETCCGLPFLLGLMF